MHLLNIEQEAFMQRGDKLIFQATMHDGSVLRRFQVHRSDSLTQLRDELRLLKSFDTWHVMVAYGGCFDASHAVVGLVSEEFDHYYSLPQFLTLNVPWCVRATVAAGLAKLSEVVGVGGVLCRWDLSNFVIRKKDYRVVLVDASSWKKSSARDGLLGAAVSCEHDAECFDAHQCLVRWSDQAKPSPDATCDKKRKKCKGVSSQAHDYVLGATFFNVLRKRVGTGDKLQHHKADFFNSFNPGERELLAALDRLSFEMSAVSPVKRTSAKLARHQILKIMSTYNAQDCMTMWQWHQRDS